MMNQTQNDLRLDRVRPLVTTNMLCVYRKLCGLCVFLLLVLGGLPPQSVHGQWDSLRLQPLSPHALTEGGVQLFKKGRTADALPLLEKAFAADPTLTVSPHGSVAYWLGEAYARTGDSTQARSTWRQGFTRLSNADHFDIRLADAYLRTLTRNELRDDRLRAVDAYAEMMKRIGPDTSSAVQSLYRRRVAQIAPLLPDHVFADVIDGNRDEEPSTWTLRASAGDSLQAWWRGLDPYPDTPENERLEEHLTRLVHARQSFSCPEQPSSLDDRGTAYLRFGAPYKRHELNYKDGEFFREVFRFGVSIPPSSFPKSELWIYPQIDDSGQYLFAEDGTTDCFFVAQANDLLPSTLKMRRGNSERGLNIAYSSLMAMREIYRELALYHITYSGRYSDIADYASYQEMQATKAKMEAAFGDEASSGGAQQQVTVGAGVGQTRTVTSNPMFGIPPPNQFVSRMVSRAEREDKAAARRRDEDMPRQYTALYDNVPQLPVAVRTARFLNEDGTTRTEIYWGMQAAEARLNPDEDDEEPAPSMIRFSVLQENRDRSEVQRQNRRHTLSAKPGQNQPVLISNPVVFENISSLHHLSMQWTQHRLWQNEDGSIAGLGPKRRFTSAQTDSLPALRPSGPGPEMSDLKVLSLPDTSAATLARPAEQAFPYPFETIRAATPLLLSFEVYHLTFGPDDRTEYTVSYEVEGETQRGWSRIIRGQDTQSTSTETKMEGTERRTEEYILIDLSEIERDESQTVRVTVTVTDDVAGRSVSRDVNFVLEPPEGS